MGRHSETIPTGLSPSYDPVSGAFSFKGVPPGQYSLLALWHDREREHSNEVAVTVTDQDVIALQISDAGTVHLAVELQPCEAGSAAVRELYLKRADGHLRGGTKFAWVSPGTTNHFDFPGVQGGKYFVDVVGSAGEYIAETSWTPEGFAGNLIGVPDGGGSITANVQVGCDVSKLTGGVNGEEGVSAQAIVVIRSSLTGETFQLTTAADGNFTFSGLAPGDYQLYAISATGQNSQLSDPPTDEKTGTRVALNPNGTDYIVVPLTD